MLCVFLLSFVFVLGDAALLDSFPKCGMSDNDCHKELFQEVFNSIGKTGVKELGIPPIDPLELKNVSVSIADLLDVTLIEGVVKGVKDCKIDSMATDIPRGDQSVDLTCDLITVKGRYKASSSSPLVKSLLGGDFVHGDGIGKVKLEKLRLHFDFKVYAHRGEDGEIYLISPKNETTYSFKILGNIVFAANNIFLGNEDVSEVVVRLLNQNAKSFAPFFGGPFMEKALDFLDELSGKFFEHVPARNYIKDDLSQYVKN